MGLGRRVIDVNLMGTANVIRAALTYLPTPSGRVVTVASTLGIRALSDATAYCASKFAVGGVHAGAGRELAGPGSG
jgi:NAD(P)-dependent dehydrogenase (short-subunit alcohol dehydrogenase family)